MYPNPTPYFIFNFLIISFIFIENECLSDAIWDLKRKKKSSAKGGIELGSIATKSTRLTIYTTETDIWCMSFIWCASFISDDYLNHALVSGVGVNSLSQQGGLFALLVAYVCVHKYKLII